MTKETSTLNWLEILTWLAKCSNPEFSLQRTTMKIPILGSIVVSIPACHAGDRGSIPRRGDIFFFTNVSTRFSFLLKNELFGFHFSQNPGLFFQCFTLIHLYFNREYFILCRAVVELSCQSDLIIKELGLRS